MFWIIGVILFGVLYAVHLWHSNRNLPPGPWGVPIFGYLPWLNPTKPYETFTALACKYGPIYSIQMGKHFAVVMSDPTMVRMALARNELADRTNFEVINEIMQEHGLIFAHGPLWKEQRKFVCNWLKVIGVTKFGDKKNNLQLLIADAVSTTISKLRQSNNSPIDTGTFFLVHIGDFINLIVLGKAWPEDDPNWIYLRNLAEDGSKKFSIATPLSVLPILKVIPKYSNTVFEVIEGVKNTHLIYKTLMEKRGNEINGCDDLMAMFMKEMTKRTNDKVSHYFTEKQCCFLLSDLFGAGVETTVNTLRWFLLYMALHQEIQNDLQTLLDSVFTDGGIIDLEHIENIPLLKACVAETMRLRPVAPSGIPRSVNSEITISGYRIPKGTMILPLQWAMHHDEKYWTDPQTFQPKRFLDDEGNMINNKAFMPFQAGKRACVGDTLSYWILYLFGANIIHNFNVSTEPGLSEKEIDTIMDGVFGITLSPATHNIVFKSRV
ncbi:cytochrome P450 306a1-like [Myzus persicae]|uniref:cytochrome P450 306a1-like n=1 Tax=Myzus persicae TaxID=13164 RepID=UPI000B937BCB|nr:cytochrome P450 306a1-like [Myzus persicae]XP_022168002.1 cytochrome P450 306a1-like [Myzus persicae]XP_022168003.1 cytochrome P450 306a1-like [Myzus persicae]